MVYCICSSWPLGTLKNSVALLLLPSQAWESSMDLRNFFGATSNLKANSIAFFSKFENNSLIVKPLPTQPTQMSSRRLKKVTTSYDQTRRHHNVWKKTSDLRRLEDVWFALSLIRLICDVLKTSDLRRLEDVQFATSWKCLIYDVFRTFELRRLEDVRFTSSWRRPIYDVWFRTYDLEDVWFMTSWRLL